MKIGFVIPILEECDIEKKYNAIENVCSGLKINFDVLFALNGKLNNMFTLIRKRFIETSNVRALKIDRVCNENILITIAMNYCEGYDATFIYSGKDDINEELVKNMINSWKAGNKLVYAKNEYTGIKKIWLGIKRSFYNLGLKILNVFNDNFAEINIQVLDNEVVKTINQLPSKNKQLRVLDSFVGYSIDVVKNKVLTEKKSKEQKIEDKKIRNENKAYFEKSQNYYIDFSLTIGLFALSIILLTIGILSLSLHWNLGFLLGFFIWVGFIVSLVISAIFATKTTLSGRAGEQIDMLEIKTLQEKLEKYNFKTTNRVKKNEE